MMDDATYHCPCCGQVSDRPSDAELAARELPIIAGHVVRALAARSGEYLGGHELYDAVYGHRWDGGPDYPGQVISQAIARARPTLARHRLRIISKAGRGYMLEGIEQ